MSSTPTPLSPTPSTPPDGQPRRDAGGRIASPCINLCRMDPRTGWCEGCHRSIDEIAAWSGLDEAGKAAVWAQLPGRQARAA